MKEQILDVVKTTLEKIKTFSKVHPKLSLFVFGVIIGLFVAFIF
jgi:uncharacterized membrane protein (DUF106 family)